ncbi:MAG: hypothetical protein OEZ02_01105 [Anaerolineae bacterium]|nr:hypothetical protein [Anaerolineae bacterium]
MVAIFIAIATGGQIQAWAFTEAPPKPPLYDLLRPFPLWSMWLYLLAPLPILFSPLKLLGIDILAGPPWFFYAANIVYFYLLACLLAAAYRGLKTKLTAVRNVG